MTENEAIEVLNNFDMQVSAKADGAYQTTIGEMACKVAVKALTEIQQYRAIGTVGECREAMEMQKKKKPNLVTPCKSVNYYQYPACGELVSMNENFCNNCGQALYWEE